MKRTLVALATVLAWLPGPAVTAQSQSMRPYRVIDFFAISNYAYNPKAPWDSMPPKADFTIPPAVRALDGQKVRIVGNAMALDYSSGSMTEFILNATFDACGFGADPRINEWIHVRMAPGLKASIFTGIELEVSGTFSIKEQVEDGRVIGLYSMVADSVK
jgi:hypothetical protein